MAIAKRECPQCGKQFTSSWKFCSFACKEQRTREFTAKAAQARRERIAALEAGLPLAIAIKDGHGPTILRELRELCTVNSSGCWIPRERYGPNGERQIYNQGGYRRVTVAGKGYSLHRLALEAATGVSLGRMHAHHTCARRACCNPEHLQPATAIQNNLEMLERASYRRRISDLEKALRSLQPDHPLLRLAS